MKFINYLYFFVDLSQSSVSLIFFQQSSISFSPLATASLSSCEPFYVRFFIVSGSVKLVLLSFNVLFKFEGPKSFSFLLNLINKLL
jgi:hypothetical protein